MQHRFRLASAAFLLSALVLPVAAPAFAADPAPAMAAAPGAAPMTGDPVVARINGTEIHRSDVVREIQLLGPQAQQVPPQMLYPQVLQRMIATKLVSAKGYEDGLQNDPEVKAKLKDAEAQIVAETYVHRQIQPQLTDARIKSKYDELVSSKFKPQDEVRARHILVKTPAEADDILKQLKGGADFAKLAEEKSKDPGSAKQGGDLGYFTKDAMVKPFADAAFAMKPGEITQTPIHTEFGYHIIQVEDRRKSSPPPLAEVHDQIANQLGQDLTNDLVKKLQAGAKVEKYNLDGSPMKDAPATK